MKIYKLLFSVVISCFVLTGCKSDVKKDGVNTNVIAANSKKVSLSISGMTCEIGCAKTIQSKLTKKEGVLNAKVVFKDSIATIEYDTNKTSKKDLIAFVDGIAGGELYKASETSKKMNSSHKCSKECKEKCELMKDKKACKEDCKMECCKDVASK